MREFDFDNMYCGAIKRGDVVLSSEGQQEKPYLVLQDDILNNGLPTVICARIVPYTPKIKILINEVLLKRQETGLGNDGVCLLHKVQTLERGNIIAKKGELKEETLQKVFKALDATLGRFREM